MGLVAVREISLETDVTYVPLSPFNISEVKESSFLHLLEIISA